MKKYYICPTMRIEEAEAAQMLAESLIIDGETTVDGSEALTQLSRVRVGVTTGLIKDISLDTINRLIVEIQPATLMQNTGKQLTAQERDAVRATLIRNNF